jgi:hypothetical protein
VCPACPPTTGMTYLPASVGSPTTLATKVEARKQSKVVTPNNLWRDIIALIEYPIEANACGRLPLGVEDSLLLQYLGKDGDSGVDRVGNDQDESLRTSLSDRFGQSGTDSSVDLKSVELVISTTRLLILYFIDLRSDKHKEFGKLWMISQSILLPSFILNLRKGHHGCY